MKILLLIFLTILQSEQTEGFNIFKTEVPFAHSNLKAVYQLNNQNLIFIETYERGDRIWMKEHKSNKINEIAYLMNFILLAKSCEFIDVENIYFGQSREYWLGGGAIIDNAQIRIFDIRDPSPWRDSDLGIVKSMRDAAENCDFYLPIFYK